MPARKGVFRVGGGKVREVAIRQQLRHPIGDWQAERSGWKNAASDPALFLSRRGCRLTTRAASTAFISIAEAAGPDDEITAHVGRHTFFTHPAPRRRPTRRPRPPHSRQVTDPVAWPGRLIRPGALARWKNVVANME